MIEANLKPEIKIPRRAKLISNLACQNAEFELLFDLASSLKERKKSKEAQFILVMANCFKAYEEHNYITQSILIDYIIEKKALSKTKSVNLLNHFFLKYGFFNEHEVMSVDSEGKKRKCRCIFVSSDLVKLIRDIDKVLAGPVTTEIVSRIEEPKTPVKPQLTDVATTAAIPPNENRLITLRESCTSYINLLMSLGQTNKTKMKTGVITIKPNNAQNFLCNYIITTWTDEDSVMLRSDLRYWFAAQNLIFHSHLARLNDYRYMSKIPENKTHIHIDDVIKVVYPNSKGSQSIGGYQRKKCREAFQRLRKTVIQLIPHCDTNLTTLNNVIPQEKTRIAQEVELKPFNKLTRVEYFNSDQEFGQSTMDYIVELPDQIFETLVSEQFHWLMPTSLLSMSDFLFTLYLYLRNLMSDKKSLNVIDLKAFYYLHPGLSDDFCGFISLLEKELVHLCRKQRKIEHYSVSKEPYKKRFEIELFGYLCLVDLKKLTIIVELDKEAFHRSLNLNESRKTPTFTNQLANLSLKEILEKEDFSDDESDTLADVIKMSRKAVSSTALGAQKCLVRTFKEVERGGGYVKLETTVGGLEFVYITLLSSSETLNQYSRFIASSLGMEMSVVNQYLHQIKSSLPQRIAGYIVEFDTLLRVFMLFCETRQIDTPKPSDEITLLKQAEKNPEMFTELIKNC